MRNMKLFSVVSWIITILVPVSLVLIGVRLMMSSAFLQIDYNMPGFPNDRYGFTKADRLYWAQFAVDYLINREGISYLGDLHFENGDPLYNDRELMHMIDVKNVVKPALLVMYASLLILLGCGIWAWRTGWWSDYQFSVGRGGWLTVFLFAAMIFFVSIGFNTFFVSFHNVFFQPGTWTFYYSDTLIRLFPERFWLNTFIFVGAFSILCGFLIGWSLRHQSKR
jgi:integral membrane protein (TIGR01906 family)